MLSKQILYLIFFSVFVINFTTSHLMVPRQDDLSIIVEKVNRILKQCFLTRLNPLIITKDLASYINDGSTDGPGSTSILLIDDLFKLNVSPNTNPGMAIFIISAHSEEQLNVTLSTIRLSSWWNTKSIFFLVQSLNNSCVRAFKILTIAWESRILSVVYFCYHADKSEVMLYTFNPFTNRAPHLWKIVKNTGKPHERWTLYRQPYYEGKELCLNIIYDKSINLDGYEIKGIATNAHHDSDLKKPHGFEALRHRTNVINYNSLSIIFSAMNVTPLVYNADTAWITLDEQYIRIKTKLLANSYDLFLNNIACFKKFNHTTSVSQLAELVILTQKRPFLQAEEKILSFYHPTIAIPIVVVIILSALVLQMNQQQAFGLALLRMWRLILGAGIEQPLNNAPTRIYFFGVFWLVIILNGTFQGNLASFLTKPKRYYVDTVKDALKLNYEIYGSIDRVEDFKHLEISSKNRSRFHALKKFDCSSYVLNNSQASCMMLAPDAAQFAETHKLYFSPPIKNFYLTHWISSQFSLTDRMNKLISRLQSSGLFDYWNKKSHVNIRKRMMGQEAEATRARFRPIKFNDLAFAFKVLIIGHVCAFIVFIFELQNRQ